MLFQLACKQSEVASNSEASMFEREYYENGNLKIELELTDSIPNGTFKEYFSNGKLKTKAKYKNGNLEGPAICYHPNETVSCIELYSNGLLNGESIYQFENGNIEYKGKFYNGKKVGIHYEFYEEEARLIKSRMEYVIVKDKNFLNGRTDYSIKGEVDSQTTQLKIYQEGDRLSIEVIEKEFDEIALVLCNYDILFNLDATTSCDTIKSVNNFSISIPYNNIDTIRGHVVNYEWISNNQTVSKDLYFTYPSPW